MSKNKDQKKLMGLVMSGSTLRLDLNRDLQKSRSK